MSICIVRAHYLSESIFKELSRLSSIGIKVVIAADFSRGEFGVGGLEHFVVSKELYAESGLFTKLPNPLWQCGDYILYIALQRYPNETNFWLMDSDVRFNIKDLQYFFDLCHNSKNDALLIGFTEAEQKWPWRNSIAQYRPDLTVFKCRFPLVFSRRDPIVYARHLRKELAKKVSVEFCKDNTIWPNDEAFFATTIVEGGYKIDDFNKICNVHSEVTFRHDPPYLDLEYLEFKVDNMIYHPVLEYSHYMPKLMRNIAFRSNFTLIEKEINKLERYGFSRANSKNILSPTKNVD